MAARSTAKVTVGPVAWNLGSASYWWPNVPYRPGYRAQLHALSVHAATDDGRTSDARYRFGFRESTQNGEHYHLNGVRVNYRGDSLQGADYDRINNGGKGDAYDTLPGFLPPSGANGGWPQAVDNYQRLNYNVVRIHQEPASPYMLDVADELRPDDHRRDRDPRLGAGPGRRPSVQREPRPRPRPARPQPPGGRPVEPDQRTELHRRLRQFRAGPLRGDERQRRHPADQHRRLARRRFAQPVPEHELPELRHVLALPRRQQQVRRGRAARWPAGPTARASTIWPACSTKQGFLWFATTTIAKRAKDADDLRPYTLLSAWAGVVPGVRTTDFLTEENRHPVYGADNLPDPWSNSVVQRVQAAFNPVAAIDLPYWSASGASDANATFPLPQAVRSYSASSTVSRNITVFNDDFTGTAVGLDWSARLDSPTGTEVASGSTTLTVPLGSRTTHNVSFRAPASGSRVYLVLSTTKSGITTFRDSVEYFTLGSAGPAPGNYRIVARHSGKPLAIAGNSTADGAKAVQQSGTATWTLSTVQDGAYTLRYTATGKMLDVNGHSTTTGVQLQQWTATGGTNQQWYLRPTGDGYYTIVGYESGLVADVYGNSTADGAPVVQWTATGGANQQWQLIPA